MSTNRTPGPAVQGECSAGSSLATTGSPLLIASSTVSGHSPTEATTMTSAHAVDARHVVGRHGAQEVQAAVVQPGGTIAADEDQAVAVTGGCGDVGEPLLRHEPSDEQCERQVQREAELLPDPASLVGLCRTEPRGVDTVAEHLDPASAAGIVARVPLAMNSSIGRIAAAPRSTCRATVPRTSRCTMRTTTEEWCTKPTCRWTTYGVRSSRHQNAATQLVR